MTKKELAAIRSKTSVKASFCESLISYLIKFIIILIQPKKDNQNGTLNKVLHFNPFIGPSKIKILSFKLHFIIFIRFLLPETALCDFW
jgi:hypothetical protein